MILILLVNQGFLVLSSWLWLWVLLELLLFLVLGVFDSFGEPKESTLLYFVVQSAASIVFLSMSSMKGVLSFGLMSMGLSLKLGLFPLWGWVFSVVLALKNWWSVWVVLSVQKLAPVTVLSKLTPTPVFLVGVLTTLTAAGLGLFSNKLVLVVIFSSLTQSGWFLSLTLSSEEYLLLFMFVYVLSSGWFIWAFYESGWGSPKLVTTYVVLLGLMGVPPLWGFFMKLVALLSVSPILSVVLATLLILSAVLSFGFYLLLLLRLLLFATQW